MARPCVDKSVETVDKSKVCSRVENLFFAFKRHFSKLKYDLLKLKFL